MFPVPTLGGPYDAVSMRGPRHRRTYPFGFFDQDGDMVPLADIQGGVLSTTTFTERPDPPKLVATEDRPVLFAGLSPPQFGHVILNALGRLWALDQLPSDTQLLFLPWRHANMRHSPHLTPLMALLGITTPPLIIDGPRRYTQLYTATDLFGERFGGKASGKFRTWLAGRLPPAGPVDGARKVYVTRSHMGAAVGRYCNEELLEELLRADGYEIFAPEEHTLSEQVAVFQNAGRLLFAESSALHLYGLVQRSEQHVAVVQRRRDLPPLVLGQIRADDLAGFHTINVIDEIFWPPSRRDNLSVAVLNFDALRTALCHAGFLSAQAEWRAPSTSERHHSLHAGLGTQQELVPEADRAAWLKAFRQARAARRASA